MYVVPTAVHSVCGQDGAHPVSNLIDEDTGTQWWHLSGDPHWFILDLGKVYKVVGFRYFGCNLTRCKLEDVSVYVSETPDNWGAALFGPQTLGYGGQWWNYSLTAEKLGRYVYVTIPTTGSTSDEVYSSEWQAEAAESYQANDDDSDMDVATRDNVALAIVA